MKILYLCTNSLPDMQKKSIIPGMSFLRMGNFSLCAAIAAAVESGRLSEADIDASVLRVLELKTQYLGEF